MTCVGGPGILQLQNCKITVKSRDTFPLSISGQVFIENCELKNERGSCVFRADLFDENGRASITCKNNIFTYYDDIAFDERDEEGFYFKEIDFKD